jgi:hypothetical protein
MKIKECTFKGRGNFPIDMLRYDRCWPTHSNDVMAIMWSHDANLNKGSDETYEISVSSIGDFTWERWKSFGWIVADFPKQK